MNIENDAFKLRKQYQCVMKGWVDLRNLAVTKETYGKVLLQKLHKLEEELDILYPEHSDDVKCKLIEYGLLHICMERVVIHDPQY